VSECVRRDRFDGSTAGGGPLAAAAPLVEVGDPRRFRSAAAFPAHTGTGPSPASSAEPAGRPVHHRLSRFGNRRRDAVLYGMATVRLHVRAETQAHVARLVAAGKTKRDALRIVKRRLTRVVWRTMRLGCPPR
jgi:transposase